MSRQCNALALVGLLATAALATENIVVGGDGSGATWQEAAADAPVIDFNTRAGWIQPRSVEENANIATGILERGGRVTSPNAQAVLRLTSNVLKERLHSMVDGDPSTAFEAKDVVATGILLVVDLGARFGVNHIRFFPRQAFKSDFMKGYVLSINDGAFGADIIAASVEKLPDKTLVTVMAQDGSNSRDTIDVRFPLQYVRYIRLESTQRFNWEIDELEIFGSGFVPEADYLSEVFDMEQDALWGRLQWATEQVGLPQRSRLIVRTRSGSSPSPDDEPDSWSPWSTPYRNSGDPILSPAPRRYFQFSMAFESDGLEDGIAVDSLAFEVFRPALAQAIVGEIWPQEVPVGVDTSFVYTIEVTDAQGFDRLEIDTPAPVRALRELRVDDQEIEFSEELGAKGLRASFARQTGNRALQVVFDTAVLRYETVFTGRLLDTTREGAIPQVIESGNAAPRFAGDDLSVRVPLKGQRLVYQVSATPAVFTPNGDGINDYTTITYDLLYLTGQAPVALQIYDLARNRVVDLPVASSGSGRFQLSWDGRDAQGRSIAARGLHLASRSRDRQRHRAQQQRGDHCLLTREKQRMTHSGQTEFAFTHSPDCRGDGRRYWCAGKGRPRQ